MSSYKSSYSATIPKSPKRNNVLQQHRFLPSSLPPPKKRCNERSFTSPVPRSIKIQSHAVINLHNYPFRLQRLFNSWKNIGTITSSITKQSLTTIVFNNLLIQLSPPIRLHPISSHLTPNHRLFDLVFGLPGVESVLLLVFLYPFFYCGLWSMQFVSPS